MSEPGIHAVSQDNTSLLLTLVIKLRQRQNGKQFADDIFKSIFLYENCWILIQISLKFVPKGPINKKPELIQKMAWHQAGNKPLSEPMMVYFTDAYLCHLASKK